MAKIEEFLTEEDEKEVVAAIQTGREENFWRDSRAY